MRFLAIDLGQKRTGLAVGDDRTRIVSPVEVIQTASPVERLKRIVAAVEKLGPDALVLGLPLNMDGSEGPPAKAIRDLAARLADLLHLPVHVHDERLSSFAAEDQLVGRDLSRADKKARRDALAAGVILQDFLASRPDLPKP